MNRCWPSLYDLIYRINGLVPKKACDYFISTMENNIKLTISESSIKYGGDNQGKKAIDNFASLPLHLLLDNKEIKAAYDLACVYLDTSLVNYVSHLQKTVCSTILRSDYSNVYAVRILKYKKGNQILDHIDTTAVGAPVYASCTLNLNSDYSGGEFSFFNGKHLETFNTGDSMVFPASPMWIHGTKPIISGTRYSINAFISPLLL